MTSAPHPHRRISAFAAKFRADNEPGTEPTDEALRATFAYCARPVSPDAYPAIREALQ